MIMSTLHRLETKLENIPSSIFNDLQSLRGQVHHVADNPQALHSPAIGDDGRRSAAMQTPVDYSFTPAGDGDDFDFEENETTPDTAGRIAISFSQHGVILWPGARQILPKKLLAAYELLGKN
jgi:hypothetical protein